MKNSKLETQGLRKFRRIRSLITIEGVGLVVLLMFILVCSILRNVNLLVVVTGMLLIPLLLSWRVSRQALRGIVVRRTLPNRIHAGQVCQIAWELANYSPSSVFQIKILDYFRLRLSRLGIVGHSVQTENVGEIVFEKVSSGETAYSSFQVCFRERGVYELGPAKIFTKSPLGLVSSWLVVEEINEIHVAPALGELNPGWANFLTSRLTNRSVVSSIRGSERNDNFYAVRPWRSGDQSKYIHWRTTAKFQQPMMKQFERSNDQQLTLILDLAAISAGADEGEQYLRMLRNSETALSFAATVVARWITFGHSRLTVSLAGKEVEMLDSSVGQDFISRVMRSLAIAQVGIGDTLNAAFQAVDRSSSSGHNSTLLVVSTRSADEASFQVDSEWRQIAEWWDVGASNFQNVFSETENPERRVLDVLFDEVSGTKA